MNGDRATLLAHLQNYSLEELGDEIARRGMVEELLSREVAELKQKLARYKTEAASERNHLEARLTERGEEIARLMSRCAEHAKEITGLIKERTSLLEVASRRFEILESAPHELFCGFLGRECACWKKEALENA